MYPSDPGQRAIREFMDEADREMAKIIESGEAGPWEAAEIARERVKARRRERAHQQRGEGVGGG